MTERAAVLRVAPEIDAAIAGRREAGPAGAATARADLIVAAARDPAAIRVAQRRGPGHAARVGRGARAGPRDTDGARRAGAIAAPAVQGVRGRVHAEPTACHLRTGTAPGVGPRPGVPRARAPVAEAPEVGVHERRAAGEQRGEGRAGDEQAVLHAHAPRNAGATGRGGLPEAHGASAAVRAADNRTRSVHSRARDA